MEDEQVRFKMLVRGDTNHGGGVDEDAFILIQQIQSARPEVLDGEGVGAGFVFFNGFSLLYDVDVFGQLAQAAGGEAGGEEEAEEERAHWYLVPFFYEVEDREYYLRVRVDSNQGECFLFLINP